jgi:hypothetical protein
MYGVGRTVVSFPLPPPPFNVIFLSAVLIVGKQKVKYGNLVYTLFNSGHSFCIQDNSHVRGTALDKKPPPLFPPLPLPSFPLPLPSSPLSPPPSSSSSPRPLYMYCIFFRHMPLISSFLLVEIEANENVVI